MNISSTSYLPALPAGKTSLPVLMLRRRCTTLNCGGLTTALVATGPNFSEPKSALIGAARRPLLGEGSGACSGYRRTIVLPGCKPNGAEVPTVILRLLPLLSGDTNLSSNWMPSMTSMRYCSSFSSVPSISMLTSDSAGGSKTPGTSSSSRITLIGAEPVFSIEIVTSKSDDTKDLILDLSYCLSNLASSTVSFCSLRPIEPVEATETLGRMDDRNPCVKLGVSASTLFSIELQLPSGGTSRLRSDTSRMGLSLPDSQTVTPDRVTTKEERFSKTDLQCQIPGRSSSTLSTLIMCSVEPDTRSKSTPETAASAEKLAEATPADILSTPLVVTIGERERVLLSPTFSLPISHEIDDSKTL